MIQEQYKISKYIAYSDTVINNKFRVLYSTRSAKTILIGVDAFQNLLSGEFDSISEVLIGQLVGILVLVLKSENELEQIINQNKNGTAQNTTLYYALQPTANCQLGCGYCGQVHSKNEMEKDLHVKTLDRIEATLIKDKSYKKLSIGWFGGEPLMGLGSIRTLSLSLIELAKKYGCEYSSKMVTNGLSLKKNLYYELVGMYNVGGFEITLDGSRRFHDNRRYTKTGENTFDLIIKNILEIIADPRFNSSIAPITIRCNTDASNREGTLELIDYLQEKDILNKVTFYSAPVHSWGNDAHLDSLSHQSYSEFELEIFQKLLSVGHKVDFLPKSTVNIVCMSLERDAELIDAFGNVYNCSEVSQVPAYENTTAYKIDNLHQMDGPYHEERPLSDWNDDILNGKVPCHDCRILPVCGGACPKLWKEGISPCPPIKQNIEKRLLLQLLKANRTGLLKQ